MSIHVQTGHRLDVVFSVGTNGRKYLQGIEPHGGTLLSLHESEAQALIDVLQTVLNEIAVQEINDGKANDQTRRNP
jgi:hypothetical protein